MGTQNTAACRTWGTKLQQSILQWRRASYVGSGESGGDKGEGQAARWVANHFWAWRGSRRRRGKGGKQEHATGRLRCKWELLLPQFKWRVCGSFPSWQGRGQPNPTSPRASVDSGADPHWHVRGSHRLHRSHEHKRKPQANSLTQNIWLDTDG